MSDAMMQEKNQRQLEVNEFHNQAGFLSDPPADQIELSESLIRGLNNCPLTQALRAEPVMCNSCINTFWNTAKINRQGAGSIEETMLKAKIIVTEAIIREVLRLGDQPHHPTSYDQTRVQASLRRMSYEGGYPTVLKKLFPPYWRLLVHFFLQCIAENKGGFDQPNKTQTSAIVALVNGWDYNFSAFIFDNMKKMLDDLKKKIFMLYPRFIQMILDDRYPTLVNGQIFINLKPMGPRCFENACRNKRAKHDNFEGRFVLETHGRFADQVQQATDDEDDVQFVDSRSETDSSEETDSESEIEIVMSDKEEDAVRKSVPMTSNNLEALLLGLQGGDGNPPSVSTAEVPETTVASQVEMEVEATADVTEESTPKKQRTDTAPDDTHSGPSTAPELKRHVVVLEQVAELKNAQIISLQQDAELKEAHISSLQSQLTNRDLTIDQLQGDVGMLMSTVYDLKAKLDKKFGNEFVDKEDE
ncbi:hypothetical protein Hanom_Chr06g00556221 [Helianthus anomalus]